MAPDIRSGDSDDTDLRDRQARDRLVRRARASGRREPPRRVRAPAYRLSDDVETIDRVADRIANDVNALFRAWSASNAEAFKGVVTIAGNIALDLFGDTQGRRPAHAGDAYDADDRDVPPRRRSPDRAEDVGGDLADFTHSLSDALAGAASVVARSSRRFQNEFDSALDETVDYDSDLGRTGTDPIEGASRDPSSRDARGAVDDAGAHAGAAIDEAGAAIDDAAEGLGEPPRGTRRGR